MQHQKWGRINISSESGTQPDASSRENHGEMRAANSGHGLQHPALSVIGDTSVHATVAVRCGVLPRITWLEPPVSRAGKVSRLSA